MKVTDVKIRKVEDQKRLKAVATITFDDCFVVHDIRVIEGENGLFIAMPSRKNTSGGFKDVAHPIVSETRKEIESAVLDKYNE